MKKEKAIPEYVGTTSEGRELAEPALSSLRYVHFAGKTTWQSSETHRFKGVNFEVGYISQEELKSYRI